MSLKETLVAIAAALLAAVAQADQKCPAWLDQNLRLLHSGTSKNLCDAYGGKPLLIVNTASHCGYTSQFSGLEAIHKKYKDRGLVVLGFPSNDFFQEEDKEEDAAKICYVNYGVSFDMFAPSHVRGSAANPVFAALGSAQRSPKWNFYKYLVDRDGRIVASFGSTTEPDDKTLIAAIETLVSQP